MTARPTRAAVVVRCFRFLSAPLVDGNSGRLSITRCLAVFNTLLAAHAIEQHHPVSGTALALLIMATAAAFGKSTFGFFLERYQMKTAVEQRDTHTTVDQTTRLIAERRNAETGFEPSP